MTSKPSKTSFKKLMPCHILRHRRLHIRGLPDNYVSSGCTRLLASERVTSADTWLRGWSVIQPRYGQALRQNRRPNNSHRRHHLPCCSNLNLHSNQPNLIRLHHFGASAVSGFGTAMFFPANNSAVMAKARQGNYGSISGLLRTLQNVGVLGSFVVAISVASASIPRQLAFQVFISTVKLSGGLSSSFIGGIQAALYASIAILAVAAILSATRGKENRAEQAS